MGGEDFKNNNERRFFKRFKKVSDVAQQNFKNKKYIPEEYQKFTKRFVDNNKESIKKRPYYKQIVKMLPSFLLSFSVLAVKNKNVIMPFIKTFTNLSGKLKGEDPLLSKILTIIKEYGSVIYNMDNLDSVTTVLSTLTFFLEDIPELFDYLNLERHYKDKKNDLEVAKQIIKNINHLDQELIKGPKKAKEAEERARKRAEREEQFDKEIQDLKKLLMVKKEKIKESRKDYFKTDKKKSSSSDKSKNDQEISIETLDKLRKTISLSSGLSLKPPRNTREKGSSNYKGKGKSSRNYKGESSRSYKGKGRK